MGEGAAYAVLSMQQAVEDAGLTPAEVSHPRTGLTAGSVGMTYNLMQAADITREKGPNGLPLYGAALYVIDSFGMYRNLFSD